MSRAFLMTAERLAFMTVLVISRMMASKRLASTDMRKGSMRVCAAPAATSSGLGCSMALPWCCARPRHGRCGALGAPAQASAARLLLRSDIVIRKRYPATTAKDSRVVSVPRA